MKPTDVPVIMAGIAPVIQMQLNAQATRFERLEDALAALPLVRDGKDGESVSVEDVRPIITACVQEAVKGVDVEALVRVAVAAIPMPNDGEPGPKGERGEKGDTIPIEALEPIITREIAKLTPPPGPKGERGERGEKGEPGIEGKSVSTAKVHRLIALMVHNAVEKIPAPKDGERGEKGEAGEPGPEGRSVEVAQLTPVIEVAVRKAVAELPAPKDGEPGPKGDPGEPGEPGADGRSVEIGQLIPVVDATVEKAIAKLPAAERGERGEKGEAGDRGPAAEVDPVQLKALVDTAVRELPPAPAGAKGDPGERGEPGPAGEIDEEQIAEQIAEMVNAAVDVIPPAPAGAKGDPGERGENGTSVTLKDVEPVFEGWYAKWALEFERRAADHITRFLDRIKTPENGRDGKDGAPGRDAFALDTFDIALADDERTLTVSLGVGTQVVTRSVKLSHPIYQGVWESRDYQRGDSVTWGGSTFIATRDTNEKPETSDAWRLSVKRGRDGKDGKPGEKGEPGRNGKDGKPAW